MNDLKNSGASAGGAVGGAATTEKRTLVEEGTTFKGSLTSTCPILVKGTINGDLEAPSLTVAGTGSVSGKVKAGELKSEGEISGEFDVDKVVLSGTVKDNTVIRAKALEVKLAVTGSKMQVVFGEVQLDIGDQPSREKAEPVKGAGENGKSVPPPPEG
jgi:cytoskeletal protein CcmA (bactofilin family)